MEDTKETNGIEFTELEKDTIEAAAMTERVGFLTKSWERQMYSSVLVKAMQWGRKKDKENREYFNNNRLVRKYSNRFL